MFHPEPLLLLSSARQLPPEASAGRERRRQLWFPPGTGNTNTSAGWAVCKADFAPGVWYLMLSGVGWGQWCPPYGNRASAGERGKPAAGPSLSSSTADRSYAGRGLAGTFVNGRIGPGRRAPARRQVSQERAQRGCVVISCMRRAAFGFLGGRRGLTTRRREDSRPFSSATDAGASASTMARLRLTAVRKRCVTAELRPPTAGLPLHRIRHIACRARPVHGPGCIGGVVARARRASHRLSSRSCVPLVRVCLWPSHRGLGCK